MDLPASLNPRAISFCPTLSALRGRRHIPRSAESGELMVVRLTGFGGLVLGKRVKRVRLVFKVSDVAVARRQPRYG